MMGFIKCLYSGNKIKMANPLSENIVQYIDGTASTEEQMAKDVVTFLAWAAEPHLDQDIRWGLKQFYTYL